MHITRNRLRRRVAQLALMAACSAILPTASRAQSQATTQPVKVGVILALSGAPARAGSRERDGMELALAELNGKGGIRGRPVQLVIQDDAADPNAAVSAFNFLADQDDIVAVIGSTVGSSTLAFAPLAKRAEMPVLALNSTYQITHLGNDWLFRVGIPADVEVAAAVARLRDGGYKRIGLLFSNDAYGKQGADLLRAAKELNIVASEQVATNASDYTPQLTKIRAASPDVLVIWAGTPYSGIGLKDSSQLGFDIPVLSPSAASSQATINAAAGAANLSRWEVQGVFDLSNPEARQQEAIFGFKAKFNTDPDYFVAVGWDSMMILGRALSLAEPAISRATVKAGLEKVQGYEGFGGVYSYGQAQRDGTDARSLIWERVMDGRLVRTAQ